ncbi:LysR family transcriptional regulator [Pseudonocardia sp. RS11V-5]|uniref:LysR family transcriptional regulator n=1 Tax=Pseudonocardia terrae TaxID=2905831 RepID=UPI001E5D3BCC|nr:LysR family transcriptional regulator [Pseudonocardia terrae]MCE3555428.1 LysR family transcriptional regulator [Pseudonocardia terrae]
MTLTQLSVFVLAARLGSVTAAASTLGVSEPAVSQALAALRRHFGDPLLTRGAAGMVLTPGGKRLLPIAAQLVGLGAEAEAAVRSALGAPEQVRLVAPSDVVEFVAGPLAAAFGARTAGSVELTAGVAGTGEMAALVAQRLADIALGPRLTGDRSLGLVSEPIMKCRLAVLAAPGVLLRGTPARWNWFIDPSGTDPGSEVGRLLAALGVPESRRSVFPNQTAAWDAATRGRGVATGWTHLAVHHLRRRELQVIDVPRTPVELCWHATMPPVDRRAPGATTLRRFLGTPEATKLLRSPGTGVPPSRFRPPVHVTIWS